MAEEADADHAADGENSQDFYSSDYPHKCSKDQIRSISILHEKFVRLAVKSLSVKLNRHVSMFLACTDQNTLGDFIRTLPNPSTIGIISMEPLKGCAVMEMYNSIAFDGIFPLLLEDLRKTWSEIIDLRPKLEKKETDPQSIKIAPRPEGVVLLVFETRIGDTEAMINFAIPYSVIKQVINEFTEEKINKIKNEVDAQDAQEYLKAAENGDAEKQIKLAFCYLKGEGVQQDYEKGIEWLQKAAAQEDVDAQHYLAIFFKQGSYVERNLARALELFLKVLEKKLKQNGKDSSETAGIYNDIGSCYSELGEFQKAVEYCNNALVMSKNLLEEELPETGEIYTNLGINYYCLGQYDAALENFTNGKNTNAISLGKETPGAATSCFYIASCYEAKGEFNKALSFYNEALAIYEKTSDTDSFDTANTCYCAANCCREINNYEKANEFDLKALKIRVKICKENDPVLTDSYSIIGVNYRNLGNYDNALKFHFKTLELKKKYQGNNPENTAFTLTSIGRDYEAQGDRKNAQKYFQEALAIYQSLDGFENDADETKQALERNS
ncbi:MAG: tetratricopeptide repeat protein [Treponema sp.]|jgi:tetratricopeptide (TPR) repeat protein|nr:tetratricopeptide repeat protein [Treponema sp.]